MARIIGIDLGAHSVKLALFQGGFGKLQLQDLLTVPVPQDGEAPSSLESRLDVLSGLLSQLPGEGRTVAGASYPADDASIRLVTLPFGDRDQVEKTLSFEVENLVPFDLDEMVLTSRILSVAPGNSRVLTALASRDRLRPWIEGLAGVGADPRALILDADLLGALAGEGVQAVVDIGHERTLVALCEDGRVLSARAISSGGRALTLALGRARGLAYATAEARKHAADIYADEVTEEVTEVNIQVAGEATGEVTGDLGADDGAVLRAALTPILSEVRASLIAFEDAHDVEIDGVALAGGTAQLGGLREWLEAILGVPVNLAWLDDPERALARGDDPLFGLAHGAGIKAGGGKGRSLDFRLDEFAFKGDLAYLGTLLKGAAVAAAVLGVVSVAGFGLQVQKLNSELAALDDDIIDVVASTFPEADRASLDRSSAESMMQLEALEATVRVDALGTIIADEPPVLTLLKEVSENVPAHSTATLDVQELTISETSVVMKAETDGYEAAATIESALQKSDRLQQARKGDEQKKRDKVRFTITIPLEVEGEMTDEG